MVSPYLPWPLHGGGVIRIYHLLKALKRQGHETLLLAGSADPGMNVDRALSSLCCAVRLFPAPPIGGLAAYLQSLCSLSPYPASKFASSDFKKTWNRLLNSQKFDIVWMNFSIMGEVLFTDAPQGAIVFLEEHESQELVWHDFAKEGSLAQRAFAYVNLLKLRRFEDRVLGRVKAVFSVSDLEADLMRRRVPSGVEVLTVPNGADLEYYQPIPFARREPNTVLLSGNMSVKRNIDAVLWFVEGVFPLVRKAISEVRLLIVGANPAVKVRALGSRQGVQVTGTVSDTREYHAKSRITVAPYRFGAGTKLKVVEAMACGTPLVSTSIGCRGLDVTNEKHLLIADSETDFAKCVVRLLRDPETAATMADEARRLVETKYNWRSIFGQLETGLTQLTKLG